MSISCVGIDTLLVNGVDLQTVCAITSAEGLLSNPPQKGDVIEMDWVDGAVYQKGPKGPYTMEVPVIMRASQQDVALGQLRTLQAMVGDQKTLTRRLVVNGVTINESCEAVMVNAPQIRWDFRKRAQIHAVLIWQVLTPWA